MPKVRGGADKWQSRASNAAPDYKSGVRNPRKNWQQATTEAAETYAQGVSEAIADNRFAKGVEASGNAYWQQRAETIGGARYAEGIRAGKSNYEEGFRPYRQAIESTDLTPRGPKGSAQNYQRSVEMGTVLNELKKSNKRG